MHIYFSKSHNHAFSKSRILIIISAIVIIGGALLYFFINPAAPIGPSGVAPLPDAKNATYIVDGIAFKLENGRATFVATTSSAMPPVNTGSPVNAGATETRTLTMFGEPVYGDLDKDGDIDAAVLLAYQSGGSGTFYYAALAIFEGTTPEQMTTRTTKTMFLGDRIAPQTVEIREGRAVYNYAVRRADEPMTTAPSIGKSTWIHYDASKNEIGEWVKDFEGEVGNPSQGGKLPSLTNTKWVLITVRQNGNSIFTPKKAGAFSVKFENGKASMTTDCNQMGGNYTLKGKTISFDDLFSTLMYCEGSEEATFGKYIGAAASYEIVKGDTTKPEFRITTKDGAVLHFN